MIYKSMYTYNWRTINATVCIQGLVITAILIDNL